MNTARTCQRCGECCRRGGPTLHRADEDLLQRGVLALRNLLTLRRGELVWDQPAGRLLPLDEECIKCQPKAPGWTCCFYDQESGCGIYADRPLECRLLACWDTRALEAAYREGRLTRGDVLPADSWLMELVGLHEAHCGHERLAPLVAAWLAGAETATSGILEALRYDRSLREALATRTAEQPDGPASMMLFLFGRPLVSTLASYGLGLRHSPDGAQLVRLEPQSAAD